MPILIKDMEMPETCDECEFHCYHSYGEYVCVATPLLYPFNLANSKGIRKDWCPLVEIPEPHGRLIDADALKETLDYYICEANWGDEVNRVLKWVKDELINSENTVIEAEGSENHDD